MCIRDRSHAAQERAEKVRSEAEAHAQRARDEVAALAAQREDISRPVSYTHLDVYKRQAFLRTGLPRESVTELRVFFPDPWPKAKHHKRRLVTACLLYTSRCV